MENINNILSIKNFYNNYKDFDIIWYKKFNKDKFNKTYYEIIDICQNSINENVVYSYNTFEKKYNIEDSIINNLVNKVLTDDIINKNFKLYKIYCRWENILEIDILLNNQEIFCQKTIISLSEKYISTRKLKVLYKKVIKQPKKF
jgi:ectoine hydroxylase-related dioxygenase (phytanoyl-CoA dioxygenase family)